MRRCEAAASGRQEAEDATELNKKWFFKNLSVNFAGMLTKLDNFRKINLLTALSVTLGHGSSPGSWFGKTLDSEASIRPKAMMHFPLFQISPYFRKSFRVNGKFSKYYFFLEKFCFYPQNFLKIFDSKFFTFPDFLKIHIFPPTSGKISFSSTFCNFPLFSFDLRVLTLYAIHALDTPAKIYLWINSASYVNDGKLLWFYFQIAHNYL